MTHRTFMTWRLRWQPRGLHARHLLKLSDPFFYDVFLAAMRAARANDNGVTPWAS